MLYIQYLSMILALLNIFECWWSGSSLPCIIRWLGFISMWQVIIFKILQLILGNIVKFPSLLSASLLCSSVRHLKLADIHKNKHINIDISLYKFKVSLGSKCHSLVNMLRISSLLSRLFFFFFFYLGSFLLGIQCSICPISSPIFLFSGRMRWKKKVCLILDVPVLEQHFLIVENERIVWFFFIVQDMGTEQIFSSFTCIYIWASMLNWSWVTSVGW